MIALLRAITAHVACWFEVIVKVLADADEDYSRIAAGALKGPDRCSGPFH
jgi:hypothetical protein